MKIESFTGGVGREQNRRAAADEIVERRAAFVARHPAVEGCDACRVQKDPACGIGSVRLPPSRALEIRGASADRRGLGGGWSATPTKLTSEVGAAPDTGISITIAHTAARAIVASRNRPLI
jgi:hypothetical protein